MTSTTIFHDIYSFYTNSRLSINNINTTSTAILGSVDGHATSINNLNTTSTTIFNNTNSFSSIIFRYTKYKNNIFMEKRLYESQPGTKKKQILSNSRIKSFRVMDGWRMYAKIFLLNSSTLVAWFALMFLWICGKKNVVKKSLQGPPKVTL